MEQPKRVRRHLTPALFKVAKKLDANPKLRDRVKAALAKHLQP